MPHLNAILLTTVGCAAIVAFCIFNPNHPFSRRLRLLETELKDMCRERLAFVIEQIQRIFLDMQMVERDVEEYVTVCFENLRRIARTERSVQGMFIGQASGTHLGGPRYFPGDFDDGLSDFQDAEEWTERNQRTTLADLRERIRPLAQPSPLTPIGPGEGIEASESPKLIELNENGTSNYVVEPQEAAEAVELPSTPEEEPSQDECWYDEPEKQSSNNKKQKGRIRSTLSYRRRFRIVHSSQPRDDWQFLDDDDLE